MSVVPANLLPGWTAAITDSGLEFGDTEELLLQLDELIAAAPEAEDESNEDSEDESD